MLKCIIRTYLVGLMRDVVTTDSPKSGWLQKNHAIGLYNSELRKTFFLFAAFASKQKKTKKTSVQIAGSKTINKNGVHGRRHYTYYRGGDGAEVSAYNVPKQ